MTEREVANIIIALRNKGWTSDEIDDFFVFIGTNTPTAEEAEKAKENRNR